MAIQFELAGAQIDGARDYQEDAFLITHLTDSDGNPAALLIVADGMGGHAAGNVASNMAVQAISKHVAANYPADDIPSILHECVLKANKAIKDTVAETPALEGMGCTMVTALLEKGKLWWASVGDSHLYLIRNRELLKKNADHSYGGFLDRMAAAGTPVEPEPGLARNMLMSAITGDEINEIDVPETPFELQPKDRILLCSDGLDTLSAGKIIQFSEWSDSPKECAEALLKAVEEAAMPKQDNTTVVVVSVVEKAEAKPEAPLAAAPAAAPAADVTADIARPGPAYQDAPADARSPGMGKVLMLAAGIGGFILLGALAATWLGLFGRTDAPPEVAEQAREPEGVVMEPEETPAEPGEVESGPASEPAPETAAGAAPAPAEQAPAVAAAPAAETGPDGAFRDKLSSGGLGPEMVWIPAGTFQMGSSGSSRHAEERPRHTVKVDRFAMSKYEVTIAQYEQFAKATGRPMPDTLYMEKETHPVVFVTWDDAFYYTKWLAEQTGKKYRLPSESEWEYAAGGGKTSPFWWGFDEQPNMAHCFGCGTGLDPRKPTRRGSFKPNPFGLYDTAGNVAEWVRDCWHDSYNGAPADGSVWEGGDCAYRVVRGGAYSTPPQSIRHAKRDRFKSDQSYDHVGFRVARDE